MSESVSVRIVNYVRAALESGVGEKHVAEGVAILIDKGVTPEDDTTWWRLGDVPEHISTVYDRDGDRFERADSGADKNNWVLHSMFGAPLHYPEAQPSPGYWDEGSCPFTSYPRATDE